MGYRDDKLCCDMEHDCESPVTHVDNKGWAYCDNHSTRRKAGGIPTRKLSTAEIKKLEKGETIAWFTR